MKENSPGSSKYAYRFLCAILFIFSCFLYANTLSNNYAYDDVMFVTQNSYVQQGIKAIPKILSTPHMEGFSKTSFDTYRPLSLVLFAIENQFWDNDPAVGHFFNVLLYSLCVLILFIFLDLLFDQKKRALAFTAAIIFAAHPIHTEVVSNIKSADELLCFLFAFLSLVCFIGYMRHGSFAKLLGGLLCLFLSFISKETVIAFMAVIPLVFFLYVNESKRRAIVVTIVSFGVGLLYIILRMVVVKGTYLAGDTHTILFMDNQLVKIPEGASRIATAIYSLGYYIRLLFIPNPLLCNYSYKTIPFADWGSIAVWASLAAYIFLITFGIYRVIKIKRDLWAFGMLFYIFTIALFSNIPFLIGAIFAERFAFFASVGFCILIALAVEKWLFKSQGEDNNIPAQLRQSKVLFVLAPLLLVYSTLTFSRNKDWENDYQLFKADVEKAPENSRLYYNLGNELVLNLGNDQLRPDVRQNLISEALGYLHQSVSISADNSGAYFALGKLYIMTKLYDSAEINIKKSLLISPENMQAQNYLGNVYFLTKQYQQGIDVFKAILVAKPTDTAEYKNIGICYLNLKSYDSAIKYLRHYINDCPGKSDAPYAPIADAFHAIGALDSVSKYIELSKQYGHTITLKK